MQDKCKLLAGFVRAQKRELHSLLDTNAQQYNVLVCLVGNFCARCAQAILRSAVHARLFAHKRSMRAAAQRMATSRTAGCRRLARATMAAALHHANISCRRIR